MSLNLDDVKVLCAPFDEKTLGVKIQSLSKNKDKAMLVCYLQHTDVAARLDQVDPAWSAIITDQQQAGEMFSVRMRISVKGVQREGIGEGQDPKSAASDALKRTAMLFGVGRYLYDTDTVWVSYEDSRDRFRSWTYADYKSALRPGQTGAASAQQGVPPQSLPAASAPKVAPKTLSRMELGSAITQVARAISLGTQEMGEWVQERYSKPMSKLSMSEMEDFYGVLQNEQAAKKERA